MRRVLLLLLQEATSNIDGITRNPATKGAKSVKISSLNMGMEKKRPLHVGNFDAMRLIFASMVVLFHIGILSATKALEGLTFISATFAVQAFFFVSGFLVVMSYVNSSTVKSYALKRIRRIFPAYICVVLGAAIFLVILSNFDFRDYFGSREFWRYIGFNLLLSNFSAPSLPGVFESNIERAVNASLWTIKIEVAFYCFVPFIVIAIRRWNYRTVLVSIFVASILWRVGLECAAQAFDNELLAKFSKQIPGQLSFFVAGAFAYYRTAEGQRGPGIVPVLISLAAYYLSEGWFFSLISPICVGVIVYWLAITAPKLWNTSAYGDFSYGIYLVHFPIVQVFVALGFFAAHPYEALIASLLIIITLAAISWFIVEKPFIQAKKSKVLK